MAWTWLVSLNRLSVGCGTTLKSAATSRSLGIEARAWLIAIDIIDIKFNVTAVYL